MEKKYIQAELKKEGNKITFIATDETLDRQGEVIPLDSWDISKFKSNPVLLVNHDYQVQNIVGRANRVRIESLKSGKKAMVFEPIFHGITQLSQEVEKMVQAEVLNTVSVGFLRKDPDEDGDRKVNELMEISFVPVPANPSAVQLSQLMEKGIKQDEETKIKEFIDATETEVKEGRVLSSKNKELVQNAYDALGAILKAADGPDDEPIEQTASGQGETNDTPNLGEGKAKKGRAEGNKKTIKVLQRVAKQINHALYEAKK